jgi:hypothetical protein
MSADLLTTVEAAKVLCKAPGTLCNWRNFGVGPKWISYRPPHSKRSYVRYRRTDLESFRQRNGKAS